MHFLNAFMVLDLGVFGMSPCGSSRT